MENGRFFELIDNVFENIKFDNCFDELNKYLINMYDGEFKHISMGNMVYGQGNRDEFSIVFNNIFRNNDERYTFIKRNVVRELRERGYSADSYVVGGLGVVIQVRSKEYREYFDDILRERRERMANVKQALSE